MHRVYELFLNIMLRQENYVYLKQKLGEVCTKHGERVLETSHNPISLGYTVHTGLRSLSIVIIAGVTLSAAAQSRADMTEFGSMLFLKNVSGTRCVAIVSIGARTPCIGL